MPTQRAYAMFVLCTIILFSCNSKKVKSNGSEVAVTIVDTTSVQLILLVIAIALLRMLHKNL
jgi:hypothetical protein